MPNIKASTATQKGSGVVSAGDPHIITFPQQSRLISFAAQASGGNTILIEYTLDGDSATPLWIEWSFGAANDSQVWSAAFNATLHQVRITGDGVYSYAWD
jgi:hypothetical protein